VEIDHLDVPHNSTGVGWASSLTFESFDSTVVLDPLSVKIELRTLDGGTLQSHRVEIDTIGGCRICENPFTTVRVRFVYGHGRAPRRLKSSVEFSMVVGDERVLIKRSFADVRHRLQWTFWDVLMGV
jgi:hypothetical protein